MLSFFSIYLSKYNLKAITGSVLYTSLPFLILGVFQKASNYQVANHARVTSLFSEPSYFGDYLVLMLVPCGFYQCLIFKTLKRKSQLILGFLFCMILMNIVFIQSGTALLKLITFLVFFSFIMPLSFKNKVIVGILVASIVCCSLMVKNSYVNLYLSYALRLLKYPKTFFDIGSFYDRFYPTYIVFANFFSTNGLLGLGFGGDYFEFKNLYPKHVQPEMIWMKPSLSYFNSYASKVILFFGACGALLILSLAKLGLSSRNLFLRITFLNILLTAFWGIANFTLPYLWFWLALINLSLELQQEEVEGST